MCCNFKKKRRRQPGWPLRGARRQAGCQEAEDVLRPYSALGYAWDEPALPHRLVLALPGNRRLGVFGLDKARPAGARAGRARAAGRAGGRITPALARADAQACTHSTLMLSTWEAGVRRECG